MAAASASASASETAAAVAYVAAEGADALDCCFCFQPLKPPIFQCRVGHVVCWMCHEKLRARRKCHVCGISTDGYSRCHAMESLLESIRVKCPNAALGCTTRPAYYDRNNHCQTCPHAPCHCPGEACRFMGSTAALFDHAASVHGWRTIRIRAGDRCSIHLRDGFNFLLAYCASDQWLFLVTVVRQPLDRVISMLCVNPHGTVDAKEVKCCLCYSKCYLKCDSYPMSSWLAWFLSDYHRGVEFISYFQSSTFRVACTDLSNGLPNPDKSFRFIVPNSVAKEYAIKVEARIIVE